jgi:hypothetical protein
MGKSLDQILTEVHNDGWIGVTLVTNQDNGICSYASGSARYMPAALVGPFFRPARLTTTGGEPLKAYFSDRMIDIDPPTSGPFGHSPRQPFSADATDSVGLSLSLGWGPRVLKLTLHSWGHATFSVPLEARGNLMVGVGPPVGNLTDQAVYVLSFHGVYNPPR